MILKKLQNSSGASTVVTSKKNYDEYIALGYEYVEDIEVDLDVDEAEEENIRFKLDGTNLYWKYESSFEWVLFTGGSGAGLPVGGTTGQVLAKASNADNDVEWVDQTGESSSQEHSFYPIDNGVVASYSYDKGKLYYSKISTYANGILIDETLKGRNKLIYFKLPKGIANLPMTVNRANGTSVAFPTGRKGLCFLVGNTATLRPIVDDSLYDIIPAKTSETIVATDSYEATVKIFENRMSMTLSNLDKNRLYNSTYKDLSSILSNTLEENGFTANNSGGNIIEDIFSIDIENYRNIVCVGDSNTFGFGLPDRCLNYASQILFKSSKNPVDILNAGISGDKTSNVISRISTPIPSWNQSNAYLSGDTVTYIDGRVYRANTSIAAGTAWAGGSWTLIGEIGASISSLVNLSNGMNNEVVIYIGINDIAYGSVSPSTCYANIQSIMTSLKDYGYSNVYICTIPALAPPQSNYATINSKIVEFNNLIKADTYADGIIDIYGLLVDPDTSLPYKWALISDGLHLTPKANEKISDAIIEALKLYNI